MCFVGLCMKKLVVATVTLGVLFSSPAAYCEDRLERFVDYKEGKSFVCMNNFIAPDVVGCPYITRDGDFVVEGYLDKSLDKVSFIGFDLDRNGRFSSSELYSVPPHGTSLDGRLLPIIPSYFSDKLGFGMASHIYLNLRFFLERNERKSPILEKKVEIDPEVLSLLDSG